MLVGPATIDTFLNYMTTAHPGAGAAHRRGFSKRMKRFRLAAVITMVFALSACAYGVGGTGVFLADCTKEAARHTDGIDWENARTVNLRIRQGEFSPAYLGLIQGKSYVLTVENGDDDDHYFRAIDFFRSVAVHRISVVGGRTFDKPCVDALTLQAGKTTKVRLVAVRDGSYEFQDNSLLISMALVGSSGGFITIERPRVIPQSPVESLNMFETIPIKPVSMEPQPTPGLFDDQEPEQQSTPGLFDDQAEEEKAPSASLRPETFRVPEGMFAEPSPDAIDLPAPGVESDWTPEQPIKAAPSVPVVVDSAAEMDNGMSVMPDREATVMAEPPVADVDARTKPAEPVNIPAPPEGPSADIYSDEADKPRKPGSGGNGGDDIFGVVG